MFKIIVIFDVFFWWSISTVKFFLVSRSWLIITNIISRLGLTIINFDLQSQLPGIYEIIDIRGTTIENEVERNDVFSSDKHRDHVIPRWQHMFPDNFRKITHSTGGNYENARPGSRELSAHVVFCSLIKIVFTLYIVIKLTWLCHLHREQQTNVLRHTTNRRHFKIDEFSITPKDAI